ncbi:hypothetical protein [Nonomuraea guangzhouensis]|uniref:Uncharacterized protein n=1 Tax=Nonomuraea guangzhouensis TaxID=1291555 RepID=A0ABW4GWL2_9ACTN|nr:hypothetical protein [Nonomuraea guangzhouensis]
MARYRHGDAEVEARQLTRENGQLVWEWWKWADAKPHHDADHILDGLAICTRSGREKVDFGDWIVKDADGFYAVKPDVFAAEYQPVATSQQAGEAL